MSIRTPKRPTLQFITLEDRITPTTLSSGFNEQVLATGFHGATSLTTTPDGRILVAEQDGTIAIIQGNTVLPDPLIKIKTTGYGENGLFGLELDPNFASNGYFYTYYMVPSVDGSPEFNRISRFTANGNTASLSSEKILLDLDPILAPAGSYTHNGGAMHFGPDGKLYITTGDNIDGPSAQSLTSTRGKILRINPDGTIPADNPTSFQGVSGTTSGIYRSIYALGFRNPFTFGVDPASGRIFVNDVGQDTWEEIDELKAGRNYGWPTTEGATSDPRFTGPIFTYQHGFDIDHGLAITAGTFANSSTFGGGRYSQQYFYADFVTNWIKMFDKNTGEVILLAKDLTRGGIVDLDATASGDLIYLAHGEEGGDAGVYRISKSNAPAISQQPGGARVTAGDSVTLSVIANGTGPLTYQWSRNGFDIRGATSAFLKVTTHTDDDQAVFRVVVKNAYGTVISNAATLTVTSTKPPIATISTPTSNDRFYAGQTITAKGSGFDPDSGNLPGSALTWKVDYYTDTASRPFVTDTTGDSVTFMIPNQSPYTKSNVFYRITLTVKDASGYTDTVVRDIQPQTALITLAASVPGVDVTLDGQPMGQIHTFEGVAGLLRQIAVPASVVLDGQTLPFIGWFDGDTNTSRVISTPGENTTLLAIYKRATPVKENIIVGSGAGGGPVVKVFNDGGTLQKQFFAFDPNQRGGISVATGDFTGDGVPDIAAGTGPGAVPQVAIIDGATGLTLKTMTVFEADFRGGVGVAAADFNNDGTAELIVTPGNGGGPRVRVLQANDGKTVADFFGIADVAFRGGAHASAGDINGDGTPDLVVTAGEGGGPRVAGWDGKLLLAGQEERVFDDFFAFDSALRGGANVTVGNLDGDKFADLILGAGPGGGPHISIKPGLDFQNSTAGHGGSNNSDFFAGDPDARGGVHLVAKDINGDGIPEIITTLNAGLTPVVAVYSQDGKLLESWTAFDDVPGGAYVG